MCKHYSEGEKLRGVTAYVVKGSSRTAGKLTGIPASTIRGWTRQEWWPAAEEKVRVELGGELLANISEIVDARRKEMLDRIQHGDYAYQSNGTPLFDDDGNHRRKKVGLTALTIATGTMFDKRQILMHRPTSINANAQSLADISKQLAAYAQNKQEKVIEGEVIDNV